MKNTSLILVLFIAVCTVVSSCHKDPEPQYGYAPKDPSAYNNLKKIEDFIKKNETKFQVFTIDATKDVMITSQNGIKYNIPAYAFETSSGMPATGNITISIKEILDPADMILSNKPTLASNGNILVSSGEFLVKAQQNNQNLRMRLDSGQIQRAIKIAMKNQSKNIADIPLWDGDTSLTFTQSGYNSENIMITKSTNIPLPKGVSWDQLFGKNAVADPDTVRFVLPDIFTWVNCDWLYSYPGVKTTVLCYFENEFNNETATNSKGTEANMCFFRPENSNSVIKFFGKIFDAPKGKEGFVSYQNMMPVGVKGTFLAITVKDEKFYCESKVVTIEAPAAGKTYFPVSFQLKEVTETELLNTIKSMNQ